MPCFADDEHLMGEVQAAEVIFPGVLQGAAQGADGGAALFQLLLGGGVFALQRQEKPALLYIGQAKLRQNVQRGHGPGGDDVKALPQALFLNIVLRPGGHGGDGDVQRLTALLDEADALGGAVQGRDVEGRVVALQRHGGEARAAAYIQYFFAGKVRAV